MLWHNAYYAKRKVHSCGIIQAIVSQSEGTVKQQRGSYSRSQKRLLLVAQCDILRARKAYRWFHSAKCWVYIRACNHEYRETPAGLEQIKHNTDRLLLWSYYLNRCDDDKCQCDGVLCYHKPCSCESCSVNLQHCVNWALLYNWVHFALIRPWS